MENAMDITCGVLLSHGTWNNKLYIQLISLLYDNLSMRKNVHMVSNIQKIYNKDGTSKIKTINDALNKIDINDALTVINKYNGKADCDIDIIKIIMNAYEKKIDAEEITREFGAFLSFLINSKEIIYTITISYTDTKIEGPAELIKQLGEMNNYYTDNGDKIMELYEILTDGGSDDIYMYYDLFKTYNDMFTISIHIEGITNYTRASIISYGLLSQNNTNEYFKYVTACSFLESIRINLTEGISIDLDTHRSVNKTGTIKFIDDLPTIYAYRTISELYLASLLSCNSSNTEWSSPISVKTIEELDMIYHKIINLDKQNNRYDVIDCLLTIIGARETTNNNDVARLDMIYMIDEYPAGSKLNPSIFKTIERFQSRAKNILGIEPKSSIYHANGNYKASIMRNVCLTKCKTKYLIIKDDDDIGCSLIELHGMIDKRQKEHPDAGLLTLPAASLNESARWLYGMWRFVYRPDILRLFSINNPPFLMSGEDNVTISYLDYLIRNSAKLNIDAARYFDPDPSKVTGDLDTINMYMYLEESKGAKDMNRQAIEKTIYIDTMDTILGLPLSASTEITVNDQGVKAQFIKELREYTPLLFDRVYSFEKLTLQDMNNGEPFYAFATNRPDKKELDAAAERFHDDWFTRMIPRKSKLDKSTGVVTVIDDTNPILEINEDDKETFTMKEWNDTLSDYIKKYEGDYIAKLTMGSPSIDAKVRIKLFGGKQANGIFKWLLLIMLVMVVIIFVCYVICHVRKHIRLPCHHSSHHDSSDYY